MLRWKLLALGGLTFYLFLLLPFRASTQAGAPINVTATVQGVASDALIKVFQNDKLVQVEYTDVHSPGVAEFELPDGNYTLQIEHGAGFISLPQRREITVKAGSPVELVVDIERLLEPNAEGYYSADLHTHTIASAPATLAIFGIPNHGTTPVDQAVGVQLAAGLDVVFISDHNTAAGHEGFVETAQARGVPFLLSEEITTTRWGHFNAYSLNPGKLVEFAFAKVPTQFFDEARANGAAMIQINHPLDAIGGYFFVRNNPEYNPDFEAVEVFNGSFGDDDFETILRMFQFWNEGQRYVGTAVSDDHDWKRMNAQYGTPRTYVFVEGKLTSETFLAALKAGRAFVSYGPMIVLTANETSRPGDTLRLNAGETVSLSVYVQSVDSLDDFQAEVIRNGQKIETFELSGQEQLITFEDVSEQNAWYAVRLMRSARDYVALTNPLWIEVGP